LARRDSLLVVRRAFACCSFLSFSSPLSFCSSGLASAEPVAHRLWQRSWTFKKIFYRRNAPNVETKFLDLCLHLLPFLSSPNRHPEPVTLLDIRTHYAREDERPSSSSRPPWRFPTSWSLSRPSSISSQHLQALLDSLVGHCVLRYGKHLRRIDSHKPCLLNWHRSPLLCLQFATFPIEWEHIWWAKLTPIKTCFLIKWVDPLFLLISPFQEDWVGSLSQSLEFPRHTSVIVDLPIRRAL